MVVFCHQSAFIEVWNPGTCISEFCYGTENIKEENNPPSNKYYNYSKNTSSYSKHNSYSHLLLKSRKPKQLSGGDKPESVLINVTNYCLGVIFPDDFLFFFFFLTCDKKKKNEYHISYSVPLTPRLWE